jgi:hypothetical protein
MDKEVIEKAVDISLARQYTEKILCYVMRCRFNDYRLSQKGLLSSLTSAAVTARRDFDCLLRHCDVIDILPRLSLGLVRIFYPLAAI